MRLVKAAIVGVWVVLLGALWWRNWGPAAESRAVSPAQLLTSSDSSDESPASPPEEGWFGIYLKDTKVGYSHLLVRPTAEGFAFQDETLLDLNVLGRTRRVELHERGELGPDYALRKIKFLLNSEGSSFQLEAEREENSLGVVLRTPGGDQKFSLPMDRPLYTASVIYPYLRKAGLRAGASHKLEIFDASTQSQELLEVAVIGKESIEIGSEMKTLWKLEQRLHGVSSTVWVDEEVRLWKETTPEGFVTLREPREKAQSGSQGAELDVAQLFSVQVRGELPDHKNLRRVQYEVQGLSDDFADLSDFRQSHTGTTLIVTREEVPEEGSYRLPYSAKEQAAYLAEEPLLAVRDPRIRETAARIVGDEIDPAKAARALTQWVYEALDKTPVVGIPNALEALESRQGDCNEHATLLVALARAAGIPARAAGGLVYIPGGFYYHAWAELYVGSWVSADATTGQLPTDPTHIRLVRGSLGSQARLANVLGRLKLRVEQAQ